MEGHLAQSGRMSQGGPSGGGGILVEAKGAVEIVNATKERLVQCNEGEMNCASRESQSFAFALSLFPCWGLSHPLLLLPFPSSAMPLLFTWGFPETLSHWLGRWAPTALSP